MAPDGLKSSLVSVSGNHITAVQPSTVAITSEHLTQPLPTANLTTVAVAPTVVDSAFDAALNGRQVMPVSGTFPSKNIYITNSSDVFTNLFYEFFPLIFLSLSS